MELYEIIRELRKSKGLTQKRLAEKVKITQQSLALLEKGKRKLDFDLVIDLLFAMNCTKEEFDFAIKNVLEEKYGSEHVSGIDFSDDGEILVSAHIDEEILKLIPWLCELNRDGLNKAFDQIKLLTKIPEYRKEHKKEE